MSGSDPSVRTTGTGTGRGNDDCRKRFETVLGTPVPVVVARLSQSQLLDVVKIDDPIRGVVAQTIDGQIVGAITRDIAGLRRCIDRGVLYEAEVIRVTGGSVTVEVRNQ